MRAINLLPNQAVQEKGTGIRTALPFVGSAAVPVIALILVISGYSSGQSAVTAKQAQLAAVTAEVAAAKPVAPVSTTPAPDTGALISERAQRLAALQVVLGNEVDWDATLLDVARVFPANVWLTTLTAISPTPADAAAPVVAPVATDSTTSTTSTTPVAAPPPPPAPSPTGFTIGGFTYTEEDVAALLQRLQLLPTLTNVSLVSTTQTAVANKMLIQFTVTATLQPSPAQSAP
jgi:Tfp pilus assembly protein PilN